MRSMHSHTLVSHYIRCGAAINIIIVSINRAKVQRTYRSFIEVQRKTVKPWYGGAHYYFNRPHLLLSNVRRLDARFSSRIPKLSRGLYSQTYILITRIFPFYTLRYAARAKYILRQRFHKNLSQNIINIMGTISI